MVVWASLAFGSVEAGVFTKKLQIEKKRNVVTANAAVSWTLEAPGNLIRNKRSSPNSVISSRLNHTSAAEFIRLDDAREELKKSQRNHEESGKKAVQAGLECPLLNTFEWHRPSSWAALSVSRSKANGRGEERSRMNGLARVYGEVR